MIDLFLGFDRGNKRQKTAAYVGNSWHEYVSSSMTASVNLRKVHALNEGAGNAIDLSDRTLSWEGEDYLLGDLAVQYGENATDEFNDMRRYYSKYCKVALLTSATCIARKLYPGQSQFRFYVVTGLPLTSYKEESFREKIIDGLNGTYTYSYGGSAIHAEVIILKVMLEGAGAALASGAISGSKPLTVGLVDSGSRTTNFLRFDGLTPYLEQCDTLTIGVNHALELINDYMVQTYDRDLTPLEMILLQQAYVRGSDYPDIYVDGNVIHANTFKLIMDKIFDAVGEKRHTGIAKKWGNDRGGVARGFAKVVHVGGGSYFFHRSLKELLPTATRPERPECLNAYGYAVLADRLQANVLRRA